MATPGVPAGDSGEQKDKIIKGHRYDGIQEYDNPMPGWWVWIFYATIFFSLVYVLGVHFFDFINSYEDDLSQSQQTLEVQRAAFAEANPTFQADAASLQKYVDDKTAIDQGKQQYGTYCAACHGDQGQGLIGPNLTDENWIHGGQNTDIYKVVTEGVAAKGMPSWNGALTGEQRAQVVAYIRSIAGTNPPGAKAPEGEKVAANS